MEKKRLVVAVALLFAMTTCVDAQGWLGRLKDKAVDKVKQKIEGKVESEVDKTMDGVLGGTSDGQESRKSKNSRADEEAAADNTPDATYHNVKSDFVRGSVILFQDDFAGEQMGEFPSKWDISEGSVETASVNGKKYLHSNAPYSKFSPLMENMRSSANKER